MGYNSLDGTQRRYDLGKWLVENGYDLDDIMENREIRSDEWYIQQGLEPRGLTFQFLSNKRPDLGYKSQNVHFRVDSAGTDKGIWKPRVSEHLTSLNRGKLTMEPHPSPIGYYADVYGCAGAHGVIVSEFNNTTEDPRKVQCGICRSIMRKAITEYQNLLVKQAEEEAKKPKFTKMELRQKMLWYKYLYNEGERDRKLIQSIKRVKAMLDTRHYIRYDSRTINPDWKKRGWTKAYLEGKLKEYAKTYIEGERDPKLIESIDRVTYALIAGQYK